MNKLYIGIFGRRNVGKSSLVNAIAGQQVAVVSHVAGTTTDAVNKPMEIAGIGPVVFTDTAGFDDFDGELGASRLEKTRRAAEKIDIAVVVFDGGFSGVSGISGDDFSLELEWISDFRARNVPVVAVLGKGDLAAGGIDAAGSAELADSVAAGFGALTAKIETKTGVKPIMVSARTGEGIDKLLAAIANAKSALKADEESIFGNLVTTGDTVLLVMPQDASAPLGRLILPQNQAIRELLDRHCVVLGCQPEEMERTLESLQQAPKLVVTDSQAFAAVSAKTPQESLLTSFSVLFARLKGDIRTFVEGAAAIDKLTENSRVLIAEACSHAPQTEDIGREKIPRMLRKRVGEGLRIDVMGGDDFPTQLSDDQLLIHCGACMFNRRHVLNRIAQVGRQGVPITNYGVAIAHLTGVLDKVVYPE
jgi:[FeFe] hydrogenase H-cluster maturation GTPase HydF